MENETKKEIQKKYIFNTICFSTNFINFNSMKFLNQYFMSAECYDINNIDDYNVTFKHKLKFGKDYEFECFNSYFEVSPMKKSVKLSKERDCFIIFVDLEYNDSLGELNKILKILQHLSENDKNLYIVNFYTDEKEIKKNINENRIKNILNRNGFNNFDINHYHLLLFWVSIFF